MKQIIPFTKDIALKTTIGELTSISLDHDLQLKGEDLITGNFYIKGKYKLTKASQLEEDFSYKIPCEIAISDDYDTYDAVIDIDDFYYDVIENEILKINISLCIDNLIKKERIEKEEVLEVRQEEEELPNNFVFTYDEEKEKIENQEINININQNIEKEREEIEPLKLIKETKQEIFEDIKEEFSTYFVYLVQENDSFEKITEKYNCKKEDILLYNDIQELSSGMKLVIPEIKNG